MKNDIKCYETHGSDLTILTATRVSYNNTGSKGEEKDQKLINYLIKHNHTSPFEMASIIFMVVCPIFLARQWVRHRTASINEVSGRYVELDSNFYIPEKLRLQSDKNKQCSFGFLSDVKNEASIELIKKHSDDSYNLYKKLLKTGVCREQARMVLPLNLLVTFYWKMDLNNLMKFLSSRCTGEAQFEFNFYTDKIKNILEEHFPMVYKAYKLKSGGKL